MGKQTKEQVRLNVEIDLGNNTSIRGDTSVPLENVVKEITRSIYDHPKYWSDYDERTEYALTEIARGAIQVLQMRPRPEKYQAQIEAYQRFIDFIEIE